MKSPEITTYQAAVVQSKAHRALKAEVSRFLRDYNLTMMQWSILGFIHDAGQKGARISDLAESLDTSLAFITTSINVLEAKGTVYREAHGQDNRAKIVRLTDTFKPKVAAIEKDLSVRMRDWFAANITEEELATYMEVLGKIAKSNG